MGVIDLSRRVTKLENADIASGSELDQLEAAVTGIENELSVTVADVTDDCTEFQIEGVTLTSATLVTYGKLALFQATFVSDATSLAGIIGLYRIPDALQPPGTRICIENDPGQIWLQKTGSHTYVSCSIKGKTMADEPAVTRYISVLWIADPPTT